MNQAAPASAEQTAVAQAVQETVQDIAQSAAPQQAAEPSINLSGRLFFDLCTFVGNRPYGTVVDIRPGLWEIQKAQNCVSPQQLPAVVTISVNNINVIGNKLQSFPFDEVAPLFDAFQKEVQEFVNKANEGAQVAAAEAALASTVAEAAANAADPAANDASVTADAPMADAPAAEASA